MLLRITAVLVCVCALASPQKKAPAKSRSTAEAKAAPVVWPVESIDIEGLKYYTPEQVRRGLALEIGRSASPKQLDAARERLLATGAFESVGLRYAPSADAKGYAVTVQVVESGPRFPLRFEDLGVSNEKLTEVLKRADPFFSPEVPATPPLLARYAKAIQDSLGERGAGIKVIGKIEPDDAGKVGVVFRPAGGHPSVARVRFTGNSAVASTELENAINGVAVGVPYKEARFRQVLDSQLRPLYEDHGRVRVSFPELRTEPDKQVNGLIVDVKVDEGAAYTLGTVAFTGTGLTPAELKKAGEEFKAGVPFRREAIETGIKKLESRVRRLGYMHVKSNVERRIDDKAKRVDLVVRFEPGPRYTFGSLRIEGLDLIAEPAIRKMWGLKEGQPFNSEYPDYFLARVNEEGIFENLGVTKAVLDTNDANRTVNVTLLFKGEAPKPKKKEGLPDPEPPPDLPGPFGAL